MKEFLWFEWAERDEHFWWLTTEKSYNKEAGREPAPKEGFSLWDLILGPRSVRACPLRATLRCATFSQWIKAHLHTRKETIWKWDESYKWRQKNYSGGGGTWVTSSDLPDVSFPCWALRTTASESCDPSSESRNRQGAVGSPTQIPGTVTTTVKNNTKIKVNQKLAGPLWKKPHNFGARHKGMPDAIHEKYLWVCIHTHTHILTYTNAICVYVRDVRIWKDVTKWLKNSSRTGAGKLRPSGQITPQPVLQMSFPGAQPCGLLTSYFYFALQKQSWAAVTMACRACNVYYLALSRKFADLWPRKINW